MLVLATFLATGVFSVAFLLRFLFALHSETRIEKKRSARTKQIAGNCILIAGDLRNGVPCAPAAVSSQSAIGWQIGGRAVGVLGQNPALGFTMVYSNPQLAQQNIEGLTALLARTTPSGVTLALSESARTSETPKAMQRR